MGSITAKISAKNSRRQFLIDLKTVIAMENIPQEILFNWDRTAISIVLHSSWTLELKVSKRIKIDKHQFTAFLWLLSW